MKPFLSGLPDGSLAVFLNRTRVGSLCREGGRYIFVYLRDYVAQKGAKPISVALPVRSEPYMSDSLFPFFSAMLAQGWLKKHQDEAFGRDPLEVLRRTGRRMPGAISLGPLAPDEVNV
jgi:serine/threonine-protein kinase HipA